MLLGWKWGIPHLHPWSMSSAIALSITIHTVNSGSEMVEAKHVSGKNIFWSTLTVKSRGGKIFEFLHCPFEGRANMHHKIQPNWLTGRCCLAGGSKGQCRKSKIFLSLLLPMQVDQYIFFPETCFAPTISEPEFTVWTRSLVSRALCQPKDKLLQSSSLAFF